MERRWLLIIAGIFIGSALGLAVLEGIPREPTSRFFPQQTLRYERLSLTPQGTSHPSDEQGTISSSAVEIGAIAPDFSLLDMEGRTVQLSDYRGYTVLVNFWATWCAPCRSEMPLLENRYERLAEEGFIVLAVNFAEPEQDVRDFMQEFSLTFPILLDPDASVHELYRIKGYPTSVFVNSEGRIEIIHLGKIQERQLDSYLHSVGLDV